MIALVHLDYSIALGTLIHLAALIGALVLLSRSISKQMSRIEDKQDKLIRAMHLGSEGKDATQN